jgi:hypothetical protein
MRAASAHLLLLLLLLLLHNLPAFAVVDVEETGPYNQCV